MNINPVLQNYYNIQVYIYTKYVTQHCSGVQ